MSKESLFKRLAKNAADMEAKGFIDNAKLDAANAEIEAALREGLGYDQLRLEWYKKMLREASAKQWEKQQHPAVNINNEGLVGVINDGRFKSQYETGSSGGWYEPDFRNEIENKMFGTDIDRTSGKVDVGTMPIYGAADGKASRLSQYGENLVLLSPKVRNEMTYSIGDSLDGGGLSGRYGFSDWTAAFTDKDAFLKSLAQSSKDLKRLDKREKELMRNYINAGTEEEREAFMTEAIDVADDRRRINEGRQRLVNNKANNLFERIRQLNGEKVDNPVSYIENQYLGGLSADDVDGVLRDYYLDYSIDEHPSHRKKFRSEGLVPNSAIAARQLSEAKKQWQLINNKDAITDGTFLPAFITSEELARRIAMINNNHPELNIKTLEDLNKYYREKGIPQYRIKD